MIHGNLELPLRMQVVRRHRHIDPARPWLPVTAPEEAFRHDLRTIHTCLEDLERSAGRDAQARGRLLQLLSFDLPPSIVEPEDGNYSRLRRSIEADRELLDQVVLTNGKEHIPAESENQIEYETEARFSWTPPAWPNRLAEGPERRPFESSAAVWDDRLWRGYLQFRIQDDLEPRLAPEYRLEGVCVEDGVAAAGRYRAAEARGHLWGNSGRPGLMVFLQILIAGRTRTVKLWLSLPSDRHRFWLRVGNRAAAGRRLWQHLARSGPGHQHGPLAATVALVATLEARRGPDSDDLGDPILLAQIVHRHAFTDCERELVWDRLPTIVAKTEWAHLTRRLQRVLRTLGPPPRRQQALDLHHRFHQRLPASPAARDLRFLADTAEVLEIETYLDLRFVKAVLDLLGSSNFSEATGAELRDGLGPDGGNVDELSLVATVSGLTARAAFLWETGNAAGALEDLRPLAAISPDKFWAMLIANLGSWLAARIPDDLPAPSEEVRLLEAAERFGKLAEETTPSLRDCSQLNKLLHPLCEEVSILPNVPVTLWPLLRSWLLGEPLDSYRRSRYLLDLARGYLEAHLRKPAREALRCCGRWLQCSKPERIVYERLAHYFVEQIQAAKGPGRDIGTERALLEGLRLLCVPERPTHRSESDAFDAVAASLELVPWLSAAPPDTPEEQQPAAVWRAFVVRLVSEERFNPAFRSRRLWAAWTLRSMLRVATEEALMRWQAHLEQFGDADLVPEIWNAVLDELESSLDHGALLELAHRRIEVLDRWLRRRTATEKGDRWLWVEWARDAHAAGWIDERQATFLHTAAFRRPFAQCLERRIRPLWPSVPMQLLLQNNQRELKRFLDLCRGFGASWMEILRTDLAALIVPHSD